MNYTAHLFLAEPTDEHRVGSLLADFTVGPLKILCKRYSADIVSGIAHHRTVDRFTDTHETVLSAVDALAPDFGLYASIVTDVAFDHFLLKHWRRYTDESADRFLDGVYRSLAAVSGDFPERFVQVVDGLVERRWLASYIDLESTAYALKRIGMRFSRPTPLADALPGLRRSYPTLERTFLTFFPDLLTYARDPALLKSCQL